MPVPMSAATHGNKPTTPTTPGNKPMAVPLLSKDGRTSPPVDGAWRPTPDMEPACSVCTLAC